MQREAKHLGRIIQKIKPGARAVSQDADGQIRLNWDESRLGAKPTDAELDAAWLEILKADKEEEFQEKAIQEMTAIFPEAKGNGLMLALYISTTLATDPRRTQLNVVRTKLDARIASVRRATTATEASGVIW